MAVVSERGSITKRHESTDWLRALPFVEALYHDWEENPDNENRNTILTDREQGRAQMANNQKRLAKDRCWDVHHQELDS